jgi:putative SOS response-associated peptidase YedK
MCGRYVSPDQAEIEREYDIRVRDPFERIYNAAPTMTLPVIRGSGAERQCVGMRWGFVPSWWSKPEPPTSTINARAEEAASKPMWRQAVRHARCLVPALGWFEWQTRNAEVAGHGAKQPFFIHGPEMRSLAFAGLWASRQQVGAEQLSFAILTCAAVGPVTAVHNRMPVVLPEACFAEWQDPGILDGAELLQRVLQMSDAALEFYPVSTRVNSPRNQGKACIEPVQADSKSR